LSGYFQDMNPDTVSNLKAAFTSFPSCIATYVTLIGLAVLIVVNWPK
jgi:hypothetical protein